MQKVSLQSGSRVDVYDITSVRPPLVTTKGVVCKGITGYPASQARSMYFSFGNLLAFLKFVESVN